MHTPVACASQVCKSHAAVTHTSALRRVAFDQRDDQRLVRLELPSAEPAKELIDGVLDGDDGLSASCICQLMSLFGPSK